MGKADAMSSAWKLYEGGDKVAAQRQAQAVLASDANEAEKKQAADLLARLRLPRMGFVLAGVALALLLTMMTLAAMRG